MRLKLPLLRIAYSLAQLLPGYEVIGLRGWDDFIVEDSGGARYCVPTVPVVAEHLSPYALPSLGDRPSTADGFPGEDQMLRQTPCIW